MIDAAFYVRATDIVGVHVNGHAEYAESGLDIVCAGVSALVIAIANGLEEQGVPCRNTSGDDGVRIELQTDMNNDHHRVAQALLETLYNGLLDIAASTEGQHVIVRKIRLEEVGKCSQ